MICAKVWRRSRCQRCEGSAVAVSRGSALRGVCQFIYMWCYFWWLPWQHLRPVIYVLPCEVQTHRGAWMWIPKAKPPVLPHFFMCTLALAADPHPPVHAPNPVVMISMHGKVFQISFFALFSAVCSLAGFGPHPPFTKRGNEFETIAYFCLQHRPRHELSKVPGSCLVPLHNSSSTDPKIWLRKNVIKHCVTLRCPG